MYIQKDTKYFPLSVMNSLTFIVKYTIKLFDILLKNISKYYK